MSIGRHHAQQAAAAKAGLSMRTARRIEQATEPPSQRQGPRQYRTRANPFEEVWSSDVVPLLETAPKLQAVALLA